MSKFAVGIVAVVCAVSLSAFGQNKVVFDNQSGDPALVKLIGPTKTEVQVANGAKAGVDAGAGKYTIKVRYGAPGNYRYSKGQEFEVTETTTARSETTITLHKVVAGNYDSRPITEAEFGAEQRERKDAAVAGADAWRTSMEEFAKEVILVAKKSKILDAAVANTRIRQKTVFTNAKGEEIWAVFTDSFENELHGELAKHFTGKVSWSGIVQTAKNDSEKGVQTIEVKFPTQKDVPNGIEFPETVHLTVASAKVPASTLPKKGDTFSFRGVFKKQKADDIFEPVAALYGLGPNNGKILIIVSIVEAEPAK